MAGAHPLQDPFSQDDAELIAGALNGLSGSSGAGSVTLSSANTWKQVPASSVPASAYILIISKETAAGTIRFSFTNTSAPSSTFGNKFSSNDLVMEMAASQVLYVASTDATDVVNYTTKII